MRRDARAAGISAGVLDRAFAGLRPNPRVIDLDRHQPEFTLTWRSTAAASSPTRGSNTGGNC